MEFSRWLFRSAIGRIQNQLAEAGVQMVTDRQALIHVSGHPGRPELAAMYGWLKPHIVVPVHGEMRHMVEHARLALAPGVPETVLPKNGSAIRLDRKSTRLNSSH